jgi:hypothetical protein
MCVQRPAVAFERIAKRNQVYLIRVRAKLESVRGYDREGGNHEKVDDERRNE